MKWACAENGSAKNTHSKLKNGQHADTATNAAKSATTQRVVAATSV